MPPLLFRCHNPKGGGGAEHHSRDIVWEEKTTRIPELLTVGGLKGDATDCRAGNSQISKVTVAEVAQLF